MFLAKELRQLTQQEPKLKSELKAWHETAQEFRKKLTSINQDILPHFVWHYLDDADIRLKDPAYKADQNKRMQAIISALERGEVPDDHTT